MEAGEEYEYTISGVDEDDIDAPLSGTVEIDEDGNSTNTINVLADETTEGEETMTVEVAGQSADVTINDISTTQPDFSLTASSDSVDEGDSVVFTLADANQVANGDTFTYEISGVSSDDVDGSRVGTVTLDSNGEAKIVVDALADETTEGAETLTLSVAGETADVTVNDTSTTPEPGPFTLTTSVDDFTGTADDNTFSAKGGRLNDADALTGGAGDDVLDATLAADADPYLEGVETLNFDLLTNATVNDQGARISGVETVNVSGGNTLTFSNAETATQYGLSGDSTGVTMTLAQSSDTAEDAVTASLDSGKLGTVTLGDASAVDFDTINLIANGAASATITEANTAAFDETDEKIVLTGDSDIELAIDDVALGAAADGSAVASEVDASAHNGAFTLDLGELDGTALENNAKNWTGVDVIKVGLKGSNQIENINAGTEVTIDSVDSTGASGDDLLITSDGSGSDDNVTVNLATAVAGTSIDFDELTTTDVENVTINSVGEDTADATIENVMDAIVTTTAGTNLEISGDKRLTIDTVDAQAQTVTSTNTAGVTLTMANSATTDFTGGAGDDTVAFSTEAQLTSVDSVDGGEGNDTIQFNEDPVALTDDALGALANFEILAYNASSSDLGGNETVDLTKISGLNTLHILDLVTTASAKKLTVKAEDNVTVRLEETATSSSNTDEFDIQIENASDAGTDNTVNAEFVNFDDANGDDGSGRSVDGFQIDHIENLNLKMLGDEVVNSSTDNADMITVDDIDGAQLEKIVLSSENTGTNSDGDVIASDSIDIKAAQTSILSEFDASAMTGNVDIADISGAFSASGATITGGSGTNLLTGGSGTDVITGGASADTLNGGNGADTINGGAGNDTIAGNAGADAITAGSGGDFIVVEAGGDKIDISDDSDEVVDPSSAYSIGGMIIGGFNNLGSDGVTIGGVRYSDSVDINFSNAESNAAAAAPSFAASSGAFDASAVTQISGYIVGQDDIDLQGINSDTQDGEVNVFGSGGTSNAKLASGNNSTTDSTAQSFYNVKLDGDTSTLATATDLLDETKVLNELEVANGESSTNEEVTLTASSYGSSQTTVFETSDASGQFAADGSVELGLLVHAQDGSAAAFKFNDNGGSTSTEDTEIGAGELELIGVAAPGEVESTFDLA